MQSAEQAEFSCVMAPDCFSVVGPVCLGGGAIWGLPLREI
jgi:hypothetical protein